MKPKIIIYSNRNCLHPHRHTHTHIYIYIFESMQSLAFIFRIDLFISDQMNVWWWFGMVGKESVRQMIMKLWVKCWMGKYGGIFFSKEMFNSGTTYSGFIHSEKHPEILCIYIAVCSVCCQILRTKIVNIESFYPNDFFCVGLVGWLAGWLSGWFLCIWSSACDYVQQAHFGCVFVSFICLFTTIHLCRRLLNCFCVNWVSNELFYATFISNGNNIKNELTVNSIQAMWNGFIQSCFFLLAK